MRIILSNVDDDFLPWVVICGFSGVRSEEVRGRYDKPPLRWDSIKRGRKLIEIPANISKVRKRRLVPINDTLESWLDYIGPPRSGTVLAEAASNITTRRLGAILDREIKREQGWPKNSLRHSYLTYEAARRPDLSAIAIEAGTSVAKLNTNYVEATTKGEAETYFSLIPSDVFRIKT